MNRNVGGISFSLSPVLPENRWYARGLYPVPVVGLCPSRFHVLPKRWIVERSFAWLENFRRLSLDYEYLAETAEAIVQLAFSMIRLNKFFQ